MRYTLGRCERSRAAYDTENCDTTLASVFVCCQHKSACKQCLLHKRLATRTTVLVSVARITQRGAFMERLTSEFRSERAHARARR